MRRKVLLKLASDIELLAYHAGALVLSPMLLWRKWRLYTRIGLDCEFDRRRWSIQMDSPFSPSLPEEAARSSSPSTDKTGPRVMFVAYGWGEVVTTEPLVQALRAEIPDMHVMFTFKHREAIPLARKLSDEDIFPLPFDLMWPVARWIEKSKPDIVVFYEHFHVPTALRALSLTRIPTVMLHARMQRGISEEKRRIAYQRWQLKGIRHISFASETHLPGAHQLLSRKANIYVTGSIKFPAQPNELPVEREEELKNWVEAGSQGAPVLVVGSTHDKEEAFVLDAFQQIVEEGSVKKPCLLLAPRAPHRADEVAELVLSRGLKLSRRSQFSSQSEATACDVLLLDTLGELSSAYKFGVGSYVGGTFKGIAANYSSHNITEPLRYGIPVAYGEIRGNFAAEQQMCEEHGVGFRVSSAQELAAHWTDLLRSEELQRSIRDKAHALVASQANAFSDTLKILVDCINAARKKPPKHTSQNQTERDNTKSRETALSNSSH